MILTQKSKIWGESATCGILIPLSGMEPVPSAVKVQSPNHWTARRVPGEAELNACFLFLQVNLCFDQFVYKLADQIFAYYKVMAGR